MPTITPAAALTWLAMGFCAGTGWALAHWLVAKLTAPRVK